MPLTRRDWLKSSIVTFGVEEEAATKDRLTKANVEVKASSTRCIAPALYNNDQDIDALLNAPR